MRYEIYNPRQTVTIPTCRGVTTLLSGQVYETDDAEFVDDLRCYPTIAIKEVVPAIEKLRMGDLRKKAKALGLKQGVGMKKAELIALIESAL